MPRCIEHNVEWLATLLARHEVGGARHASCPTVEAQDEWTDEVVEAAQRMLFSKVDSWFTGTRSQSYRGPGPNGAALHRRLPEVPGAVPRRRRRRLRRLRPRLTAHPHDRLSASGPMRRSGAQTPPVSASRDVSEHNHRVRYLFGDTVLDTTRYSLYRNDEPQHVEPQVFDVLAHLVENRDRVVSKNELLDQVWGHQFVTESALTTRIKQLRQAVGDTGKDQRVVQTIHGRGYRFIATVQEVPRTRWSGRVLEVPEELRQDIRFCTADDGTRLAFATIGTGPPLVRAAHWITHLDYDWQSPVWRHWLVGLAHNRTLVRYDERGNGLSDHDVDDFSFEAMVRRPRDRRRRPRPRALPDPRPLPGRRGRRHVRGAPSRAGQPPRSWSAPTARAGCARADDRRRDPRSEHAVRDGAARLGQGRPRLPAILRSPGSSPTPPSSCGIVRRAAAAHDLAGERSTSCSSRGPTIDVHETRARGQGADARAACSRRHRRSPGSRVGCWPRSSRALASCRSRAATTCCARTSPRGRELLSEIDWFLEHVMQWPEGSCGARAHRRRSAKARRRRRTGGTGSAPATRRSRATATASRPATPRTSRCSPTLGLTHHRLSIEWARIEPEPGEHDPAAVAHYRDVLTAARDAGVDAVGLPAPLHAPPLVRRRRRLPRRARTAPTRGARHVEFMAETFGDLVGGWQPVNETNYYARAAYRRRRLAARPQRPRARRRVVDEAIQLATAEAAVRLRQTGAPVSSIFGLSAIVPQDDLAETARLRRPRCTSCYWAPGPRPVPRRRAPRPRPRADRAARPRRRLRPDRLLVLLGDGRARTAASPCIRPTRRCRRSATASGPTGSALVLDRLHARGARARRCSSPSTASAPTTTTQRAAYLAARARGHARRDRARHRRARLLPLDRASTTTSGSTATTSRSASSTATATCAPSAGVLRREALGA